MRGIIAAGLCLLALIATAGAQEPAITPEADKVMWCASAFFWLAGSADDAGDATEAELYDGWANKLTERGTSLLTAAGFDAARTQEIMGQYDQQVLEELASEKPRHDVATCPEPVSE